MSTTPAAKEGVMNSTTKLKIGDLKAFSHRFWVSPQAVVEFMQFLKDIRKLTKPGVFYFEFAKEHFQKVSQLVTLTKQSKEAKESFSFPAESLLACLEKQNIGFMMTQAQSIRTGGAIGFMPPETYDPADILQVAMWVADAMEQYKPSDILFE
jgi:hypothetical protein